MPLLVLAKHQAGAGHVDWIGAVSLTQRLRVTLETYLFGATFRGTLPHAVLAACGFFAVVIAGAVVIAAALLIRRAATDERRAAAIPGLIAVVSITIPLVGALGPADYFLHKNLIPVVPMLALVVAAGLGCRRSGRLGIAAATALLLVGASLTVMSFAVPSLRRPDVRLASRQLGTPSRERIVVFVPRWQLLLEHYQGGLRSVPAGGARVSEIDVFTSSETLPAGTVPSEFHLARVQHGNPFIVYTFRSRRPSTVGPKTVGTHTFTESGLQPIALLQAPR